MMRCLTALREVPDRLRRWWREPIPQPPGAPARVTSEGYPVAAGPPLPPRTLEERLTDLESAHLLLAGRVRSLEDRTPPPGA